jgi:hypothetical protein
MKYIDYCCSSLNAAMLSSDARALRIWGPIPCSQFTLAQAWTASMKSDECYYWFILEMYLLAIPMDPHCYMSVCLWGTMMASIDYMYSLRSKSLPVCSAFDNTIYLRNQEAEE